MIATKAYEKEKEKKNSVRIGSCSEVNKSEADGTHSGGVKYLQILLLRDFCKREVKLSPLVFSAIRLLEEETSRRILERRIIGAPETKD